MARSMSALKGLGLGWGMGMLLAAAACQGGDQSPGRSRHEVPPGSAGSIALPHTQDAGDPNQSFGNSDAMVPTMFTARDAGADAGGAIEDDPDDDKCGSVELEPMVNTEVDKGTLLIVFDNSGSMSSLWGDTPRWLAAGNAIRDAVSSISEFV